MSGPRKVTQRASALTTLVAVTGLALLPVRSAAAHPLGNFTTNTYAGIVVAPQEIRVDYVLDLAEVPALQARQGIDIDDDGAISDGEASRQRTHGCAQVGEGLRLTADGRPVALTVVAGSLSFPPGQAGLPTLRLECLLTGRLHGGGGTLLAIEDRNFDDRIGWREITATGERTTVTGDLPTASISRRLTDDRRTACDPR